LQQHVTRLEDLVVVRRIHVAAPEGPLTLAEGATSDPLDKI
jgi:hypothetical protein